jgi:hypothetical protein
MLFHRSFEAARTRTLWIPVEKASHAKQNVTSLLSYVFAFASICVFGKYASAIIGFRLQHYFSNMMQILIFVNPNAHHQLQTEKITVFNHNQSNIPVLVVVEIGQNYSNSFLW